MEIAYRSKNIEITNALRRHVERKLGKLERYFADPIAAQVSLNVEHGRHVVEVTVPLNGVILRGEEQTGDMYASVDLVVEKLEKQVEKYKTRLAKRMRITDERKTEVGEPEAPEPRLVKTKRFAVKPMEAGEAVMQMNLVGHDFFVFLNSETNQVNVVYRRRDGNYGLIEPDR